LVVACGRELAGLARFSTRPRVSRSETSLRRPVRALKDSSSDVSGRAVRCGRSVAGWPTTDGVVAVRDSRLASRTGGRTRHVGREETIRWARCDRGSGPPDSRVGTRQGRSRRGRACPQSGTAARPAPGSGSDPNPATPTRRWARRNTARCAMGLRCESGTARQRHSCMIRSTPRFPDDDRNRPDQANTGAPRA
jgi:hypothetical protein